MEEFQHLRISLEAIKSATGNFDKDNYIGEGGFGRVYKGVGSHSMGQGMVAFKRLDSRYHQGNPEFLKEILILSRYTHENLISLLGFCDEDGEKILVYEHASHGSLDHYLSSATLRWRQRLKICIAAATGLCYLHDSRGTQQIVLHRDVKSSNILLDENWNAKVSDMGLSKICPTNQPHSVIVSSAVGTPGYTDPVYADHNILTKESDVYSFGVVLFEVLCGRLCLLECKGRRFQNLVPKWRRTYKEKKLDEVIFEDLKQYMDPRSLETFSDIAYQCLHKSRAKRPKMCHVVEKLEIALRFQKVFEEPEPPMDYEEMCKSSVHPLLYKSTDELKTILYKGILVNGGKTWFWLNNKGEHCEMISAAECVIPIQQPWYKYGLPNPNKSRFARRFGRTVLYSKFKTHVKTQSLSPHITYTVNLVFGISYVNFKSAALLPVDILKSVAKHPLSFKHTMEEFLSVSYTLAGETKSSTLCLLPQKREDGWLMSELYQFTSDNRDVDLEITFDSQNPLIVEGIEFLPLERVPAEHEALKDEEVEIQTISHPDIYWEHKLPTGYKHMIKFLNDRVWTTKKELYSIFCQGFAIKDGKEWISLEKNGKTCHMLQARVAFRKSEWSWGSSHESRFEEVAFDPHGSFCMYCSSNLLSPQTTYGSYLVYKLQESHRGFEHPVKVYENTHNPLNRPNMKGLPQQRNDGWMEVQVWEFQTGGTTREKISKNLHLKFYDNKLLKGLIVKGIEFRPI